VGAAPGAEHERDVSAPQRGRARGLHAGRVAVRHDAAAHRGGEHRYARSVRQRAQLRVRLRVRRALAHDQQRPARVRAPAQERGAGARARRWGPPAARPTAGVRAWSTCPVQDA